MFFTSIFLKALDSKERSILLAKREHYEVRWNLFNLLQSYLSCRRQYV